MVETADSRMADDLGIATRIRCGRSHRRRALAQREVRSVVMVVSDKLGEQSMQVPFVEDDYVLEQISPHGLYPAFRRWISIFIAATQLRGRPGVVPKPMTASQPLKTPRADACPRFEATSRTLLPPISRHRGPRGSVAYAARCAGAHTSPSQRPRVLGSPPSICPLAVRHPCLRPLEERAPQTDLVLRSWRGVAGSRR